jgi:hypothetical protein
MKKSFARKVALVIAAVILLTTAFTLSASAASFDDCKRKIAGWSVASNAKSGDKVLETIILKKFDNSKGVGDVTYKATQEVTRYTNFSGSITSKISENIAFSVNSGVATISGGLASEVKSSIGWSYAVTRVIKEEINCTVKKGSRLQVSEKIHGNTQYIYARFFVTWIKFDEKEGEIRTPSYGELVMAKY